MSPLLTETQAAEFLQMSERSVRKVRQAGALRFVQIGRLIRYRIDDIQGFIENCVVVNENTATTRSSPRASSRGTKIKSFTERQKGA